MLSFAMLGQNAAFTPVNLEVDPLSHDALPYPTRTPVYLRLVKTEQQARDYARGGFHVSVTRALSGGCADAAGSVKPTPGSVCGQPLNRADLRAHWSEAAKAYIAAANRLGTVEQIKAELVSANQTADKAYGAEGVEPPRDPVLVEQYKVDPAAPVPYAEPAVAKGTVGWGLAAAGVIALGAAVTGWALKENFRGRGLAGGRRR